MVAINYETRNLVAGKRNENYKKTGKTKKQTKNESLGRKAVKNLKYTY